jgi:DNA ligase (NAD+)
MSNTSLEFAAIQGVGVAATTSLDDWWQENSEMFYELLEELSVEVPEKKTETNSTVDLSNKSFVITGSLNHFENRDALKNLLESLGAKVSGSVSKNTFALICNQDAGSSKSKKAKDLGINVWTEDDLLQYIGE